MYAVQRAADDFRVDLGSQRLAHPRWPGAEHRRTARLAGDDVVHQHVHLGGQDIDQVCLLGRQHQLVLEFRLVGVGRDVVHMHPDVMMQIEVEHQDVEMHRQFGEQPLGDAVAGFLDLAFLLARQTRVALHAAHELGQDVAAGIERQHALAEDAFVVDQARRAAGRRQDDLVLAGVIGVTVRRRRVLGEPAGAGAGKLRAVLRPPVEIARRRFVVTCQQRRRFLDVALAGEDFRDRPAGDVGPGDAHGDHGHPGTRIGLQFDKNLAAFLFRRRRVIKPRHHPGQRLASDRRREHPATRGVFGQIPGDGRHRHLQLFGFEALAALGERTAQGGNLRRPCAQLGVAGGVQRLQQIEFSSFKLLESEFDAIAETQLLAHEVEARKSLQHRFDVRPVDLQLHGLPPC